MVTTFVTKLNQVKQSILLLRFTTKDRVMFAKRLSFLLHANVSLLESLTIIRNQTTNKRKREIYNTIISDLAAGRFLSTSLTKYQKLFGSLTINVIHTGETAGSLAENLTYLADELSKRQLLKSKVQSALIYPVFITLTTFSVTGLLVMYIFPKILPIFSSLDITLPLSTRILLLVSYFLKNWGGLVVIGLVLTIVVIVAIYKTYLPLRQITAWLLLRIPITNGITRSYNCANFCRTLNLNLRSGIALAEALVITARVTDNELYKKAYGDFSQQTQSGQKISSTMHSYPLLFPEMLPQLLLIGETTGSLGASLGYLTHLYESEVDESTRNLANLIEPLLLIVMGLIVGVIAVSVLTPIYEVTQMLGSNR